MKKIRIAQIGMSETSHASDLFQTMMSMPDVFEIVGVADVDHHDKPIPDFYKQYPILPADELLRRTDLDAVAVEPDEDLQTEWALKVAERGLPMQLEKPGSESGADFDRLIDIAKKKNLLVHLGYMYRYNPLVTEAFEKVRRGDLGTIFAVEAQMDCVHHMYMRKWFGHFKGGIMFYLGCHLVDMILRLQGEPNRVVPLNRPVEPDKGTGNDFGMALFEYDTGVSFAKTCGVEVGGYARRQLVITGTKGTIEIKPLEASAGVPFMLTAEKNEWYLPADNDILPWTNRGEHGVSAPFHRYEAMMRAFASMVRGEAENPYTLDYERLLHKYVRKACGLE